MIETKLTGATQETAATLSTRPADDSLRGAVSTPVAESVPVTTTPEAAGGMPWPRVLGHIPGPADRPLLIVVGGLHGNEPAGLLALERVLKRLDADHRKLAGTLVGLVGNRRALGTRQRYVDEDLNRIWHRERLSRLRAGASPISSEESEMRSLDLEMRAAITNADGPICVLDLHTTSAPGPAFSVLNDTLPNRAFALAIPAPTVLGLEEELSGTLLSYLARSHDLRSMGFESGQHDDALAVDHAEAAIWIVLGECGVAPEEMWPEVAASRRLLEHAARALPQLVDIRYRHQIEPGDGFCMGPGFNGFQEVRHGEILADDDRGEIRAPIDGLLLMPLYQGQGMDGFFIVRKVHPFWLQLSAILRRWHLVDRFHWLPGIRRHPTIEDALIVDKRVARVLAIDLFHLVGFTRVGPSGDRFVTMRRRAFDRD